VPVKKQAGPAKKRAAPPRALAEYTAKRDFTRTAEPKGGRAPASKKLRYVIQKHAASRLHFDLRLELDGVMKSWAVPKGPSLDPAVKRLAMEVEDHPIEYNTFEGTIPEGEYGGGTVMLWDRGTYEYGGTLGGNPIDALRAAYAKGDFKFILHGERLQGSWVLVRTRRDDRGKAQWLLIKHRDEHALEGAEDEDRPDTSVTTGRSMEEIAAGNAVWRSKRSR
jgi:bifunctional non-homologous end joining protein LigD